MTAGLRRDGSRRAPEIPEQKKSGMSMDFKSVSSSAGSKATVVVGDVHGDPWALGRLLAQLEREAPEAHLVFVGDLSHKGPDSVAVYRTAIDLVADGRATVVASNHGDADMRHLGRTMARHGDVVEAACALYRAAEKLPSHATMWHVARLAGDLAGVQGGDALAGRIVALQADAPVQFEHDGMVVVHGGLTVETFRASGRKARQVCLYGTPTGVGADGRPVERDSWVDSWCQARDADPDLPVVIYGHITYPAPKVTGSTVGIDTGCGSSGPLTAAVWNGSVDTMRLVQVPSGR